MILPVTLAVWIGLVGSVFTGARRLFRTITLSYCCRVTPVLTVHFVHRSCIILVVLDSVVILFTRRPCPADMEPTDDGAGHRPCAMTEMIFLFIASLAGMMIVPCNRALVLQCSSLPSMAYLRFPLACRILLTIVLAPLASAWDIFQPPHADRAARDVSTARATSRHPHVQLTCASSLL